MSGALARSPAPERFAVRLASAAAPDALTAWLADAAPGHRAEYAAGVDLPRGEPGVVLVTRWKDAGLVTTTQERDPADARRWRFIVHKSGASSSPSNPGRGSTPAASTPAPARGTNAPGDARRGHHAVGETARSQMAALMELLRRCAARGQACPGFAETAQLLGLPHGRRGKDRAAYLYRRLAAEHRIKIDWPGGNALRVVTILKGKGAGTSTKGSER